jgi:hypothetical protein
MLEKLDMTQKLTREEYDEQVGKLQVRLRELEVKNFK